MPETVPQAPRPPRPPKPPAIPLREPKPTYEIFSISKGEHLFVGMHTEEAARLWLPYWIEQGYAPEDLVIQTTRNKVPHEVYNTKTGACLHCHSKPNAEWTLRYKIREDQIADCIVRPITGYCGR